VVSVISKTGQQGPGPIRAVEPLKKIPVVEGTSGIRLIIIIIIIIIIALGLSHYKGRTQD
jgi:hypothetical protein